MLEKMQALARRKNMCVLATVSENRPHCSLMAYVTDESCREIYMVTHKETQKYRNLKNNPWVCLLIDTRDEDSAGERLRCNALTVSGIFRPIEDHVQMEKARSRLLERHAHLKEFAAHPEAEVFSVQIESFLLLEGLTDASYEIVEGESI